MKAGLCPRERGRGGVAVKQSKVSASNRLTKAGLCRAHLDPSVAAQVKVKLVRVSDVRVHGGAGGNVPAPSDLPANTRRSSQTQTVQHFSL